MRKRLKKKLSKCHICRFGTILPFCRCEYTAPVTKVLYSFWECDCCMTVWNWREYSPRRRKHE